MPLLRSEPRWTELTVSETKQRLYRSEPQFWEGWEAVRRDLGVDAERQIAGLAELTLKPEAIVRGSGITAIDAVARHGFTPIACHRFTLTRSMARNLWRHQWNRATVDRISLTTTMGERTDSLLVVLRDDRPEPGVPGSVRLAAIKGPAQAERREPGHLRSVLGMSNRMVSFVHAPDEPADLIREHGILLAPADKHRLHKCIAFAPAPDATSIVQRAISELEGASVRHSVDPEEVMERLRSDPRRGAVLTLMSTAESGSIGLDAVAEAFGPVESEIEHWDFMVIAAELIEHDRPGVIAAIDATTRDGAIAAWSQHQATS